MNYISSAGAALIVIGDATETVDTLYPFLRLQEEGIRPVVVAPEATECPMYHPQLIPTA